jgi:hypothetical protein
MYVQKMGRTKISKYEKRRGINKKSIVTFWLFDITRSDVSSTSRLDGRVEANGSSATEVGLAGKACR